MSFSLRRICRDFSAVFLRSGAPQTGGGARTLGWSWRWIGIFTALTSAAAFRTAGRCQRLCLTDRVRPSLHTARRLFPKTRPGDRGVLGARVWTGCAISEWGFWHLPRGVRRLRSGGPPICWGGGGRARTRRRAGVRIQRERKPRDLWAQARAPRILASRGVGGRVVTINDAASVVELAYPLATERRLFDVGSATMPALRGRRLIARRRGACVRAFARVVLAEAGFWSGWRGAHLYRRVRLCA